ncbi:MAG: hypothetical protein JNL62_19730 [Bryobacterales bacterium]|nr:hypothetical protein [Bryobacterales bacterium]
MNRQPWLHSALADGVFILSPAFLVAVAVLLWPGFFTAENDVSPLLWLALVVGVDVAHVYSTLYRTYFDKEESARYRALLIFIPLGCWIVGILLYSAGKYVFWRTLAYLAVFHFVRQQYGFLRLYARKEDTGRRERMIDGAAVYLATLYPLVYWHTHPRSFHWFLPGDFVLLATGWLERATWVAYMAALGAYAIQAVVYWRRTGVVNLPKHLVLAGTALSWYVGIVRFDGDLTFTATNVVAHGIPYMALIWIFERKKSDAAIYRPALVPVFLGLLLALAYVEEAFWDVLVWRDHTHFFAWLAFLPQLEEKAALAIVVPLLAVPQATHYVLDGFIWRIRKGALGARM